MMRARWTYRAVDPSGRRIRGAEEAADAADLALALERRGLVLVRAEPSPDETAVTGRIRPGSSRAVLEMTRALAGLLPAGLPLARALDAARHVVSARMAGMLDEVRGAVERGSTLADALGAHPGTFTPLYVGMIRAGERSGDLDGAFARLAAQLEREEQLRGRLLSAAIYPLILLVMGGISVVVLLLFVIPRFAGLLEGAGARLPASTTALLTVANAFRVGWPVLVLGALALAMAAASAGVTARGKRALAASLLALPVIGALRREQIAARTARLIGVLLKGGSPLLAALDDAGATVADPIARDDLDRVRHRVREGASLHQALAESPLYPPLLMQLVGVGEESGRLEEFLTRAADLFEERIDRVVHRLVALLEPAMIVLFGAVVAFIALSLFQAIYGVNADAFR